MSHFFEVTEMITKAALILLSLVALCACSAAQENTADDWYEKGRAQLGRAPLEDVIKAYDKAIEISPNNATYWAARGSTLSFLALTTDNQSRYNESLQAYNRALQLDPENPWTWDQMGSTLLQMKRYNDSLEARDKAIVYIDEYQGNIPVTKKEMQSSIWAGKAFTLQEAGRMDEALTAFDKAIQIDPGNYEAHMMRGRALTAMGKHVDPLPASNETKELGYNATALAQENTAEGWYKKGLELELSDSREEAVQAYDKAIQLDPQNPKYWNDKAFDLWLLHRNQEANQASEKALELYNDTLQENPKDIDSWMGKAQVFNNLAFADMAGPREAYREAALYSYDQVLQIDPQNASALSLKGGALFELGRHAEAIEAIDRALKIGFPPSQEWMAEGTLQIKGLALAALGKENESEKTYQETLKGFDEAIEKADTPENLSQAWLSKGFILQEQDKYEESIKALDNATDANPKNEMAWRVKGFMLANWMGRYDEGLAALDKALDINPSADVWEAEARVFNELGRYDEALEASDNALVLNKNLIRTWLVKGHALRGIGKHQEALDAYAQAENTYDEQLWGGRGFSLAYLNRSDEAAEAFNKSLNASQKVLEKDNKSAYAWFWKGEALRGLGRYQEALESYDRSLEIGPEKAISAWRGKGFVLKSLGRDSEADAAFAEAKELGYQR